MVNAALRDLARLQAEESLVAANRIAVGGGKLKEQDARAIVADWSKAAHPGGRRGKPGVGGLAAAGFKVIRHKVPAKKK